jgi:hypothetical protein
MQIEDAFSVPIFYYLAADAVSFVVSGNRSRTPAGITLSDFNGFRSGDPKGRVARVPFATGKAAGPEGRPQR